MAERCSSSGKNINQNRPGAAAVRATYVTSYQISIARGLIARGGGQLVTAQHWSKLHVKTLAEVSGVEGRRQNQAGL